MVGRVSHKVNDNFVMRIYYQKDVLTFMCCVNELFYVCLYLLHFTYGPLSKYWPTIIIIGNLINL